VLIVWFGPADFPDPVGRPLVVAFGAALLAVGALLLRLSETIELRTLAAANAATAAAAIAWRLAAEGFSSAGSALTIGTAAALSALAVAQVSAIRPAARRSNGAG
jgi:hypothetical protein